MGSSWVASCRNRGQRCPRFPKRRAPRPKFMRLRRRPDEKPTSERRPKPGLRHPLTLDVRDGVEPPRGWLALALLCAAQFMVVLDFSIVNVALPSMQKSLGFSPTTLQWVVSAYSLLFGGFLLLGGRAADLFGRRRVFLLGLVLFTLASLGGGFAPSPIELIHAPPSPRLAPPPLPPSLPSLITTTFPQGA